jgi:DNA modification methylase/predicted RNA-binding Zn-ribbon protein involved in translation (DUF1610 family)
MEASSVDAIVTDPPYGLSKEPDMVEVLTHWLAGDDYHHTGAGFMGKSWDSFVPGPATWREAFRVLKPGGHLLCFAGTRTFDLMGISLRLAGFEIRDSMLYWGHGQGFPKSLDVSKAIDASLLRGGSNTRRLKQTNEEDRSEIGVRFEPDRNNGFKREYDAIKRVPITAPATPEAERWAGWGTALKPAHEPIVVARKPLIGTVSQNVLAHGTGALNIDQSRIGTGDNLGRPTGSGAFGLINDDGWVPTLERTNTHPQGRWPANVILSHHPACVRVGVRRVKGSNGVRGSDAGNTMYGAGKGLQRQSTGQQVGYASPDGTETISAWECHEECAVAALDAQSGERPGFRTQTDRKGRDKFAGVPYGTGMMMPAGERQGFNDTGGASRFFLTVAPDLPIDGEDVTRFCYVPKSSRAERNAGLDGMPVGMGFEKNTSKRQRRVDPDTGVVSEYDFTPRGQSNVHPCVKPLELMKWLITLVTPPGGTVLDPFTGSGSTGCAAAQLGVDFIGIEQSAEYAAIAEARIKHWAEHGDRPIKAAKVGRSQVYGYAGERKVQVCVSCERTCASGLKSCPRCGGVIEWRDEQAERARRSTASYTALPLFAAAD